MGFRHILIIGQGLAGTILSHELLKRNISHKVLDNGHKSAATKAAGGIINPITGRRYVKSWMIDDLLPVAKKVYGELESLLRVTLVSQCNIIRTFEDLGQEKRWQEATSRPGYEEYISDSSDIDSYSKLIRRPFGYGVISGGMQVNVGQLIQEYRKFLHEKEMLIIKDWATDDAGFSADGINVNGEKYDAVIFCTGYKAAAHPLFSALPFQPAKGEAFHVNMDMALPSVLLRDKIFIAPMDKHSFWTGGGYQWDGLTEEPTQTFKEAWEEKLKNLLKVDYHIVDHRAGVRPSVKGRRPLMGRHVQHKNIYLFNGMGTKGTSLAPFWAERMMDFMEKDIPLSAEVDMNRFG